MNKKLFIFYLIFWICGRIYFLSSSYLDTKIYHCIGLHFDLICLLSYIVHSTPYNKIKIKMFWVYFLIYELISLSTFSYIQLTENHIEREIVWVGMKTSGLYWKNPSVAFIEHIFIPLFIVYVAYEIYRRLSKFDKENSAELDNENIFLVLHYPNNIIGLFLCIFSLIKATSVCLYSKGYLYAYKREFGCIMKSEIDDMDKFFFINTKIPYVDREKDLESLVGKKWKINSTCLNTFQKIVGPLNNYL